MIKAILFDFYGVIGRDWFWQWVSENVEDLTSERRDFLQGLSDTLDQGLISNKTFIEEVSKYTGLPKIQANSQVIEITKIDPEVLCLISELKKANYKIGLVTNADYEFLQETMDINNLWPYFDAITISSLVRFIKPGPEIFEIALNKFSVTANEVLFIDDRPRNVAGAEKLGISGIVFTSVPQLRNDLVKHGISLQH